MSSQAERDRHAARRAAHQAENKPHPNGLTCPCCTAELWDSAPGVLLFMLPVQQVIHCDNCEFVSRRRV